MGLQPRFTPVPLVAMQVGLRHVGWAERFLRSPTWLARVGLRPGKPGLNPTYNTRRLPVVDSAIPAFHAGGRSPRRIPLPLPLRAAMLRLDASGATRHVQR